MWKSVLNTRDGWLCSFPGTTAAMCNLTRLYSLMAAMLNPSSALSWQAYLLNFSSTSSWRACSVHLCVQHPLLKLPLEATRKTKLGCHSVLVGYRHCQRGWSQPFRGHSGGRTVLFIEGRGHLGSPLQKLMTGGCPERWAGVGRAAEAASQPSRICFLISLL